LPFKPKVVRIGVPEEDIHVQSGQEAPQENAKTQVPEASEEDASPAQETITLERSIS
jgi:hypothetical protein